MCIIFLYTPIENLHTSSGEFPRREVDESQHMHILYGEDYSVAPTALNKLQIPTKVFRASTSSLPHFLLCPTLTFCPPAVFEPPNCNYCIKSYFSSLGLCRCGSSIGIPLFNLLSTSRGLESFLWLAEVVLVCLPI